MGKIGHSYTGLAISITLHQGDAENIVPTMNMQYRLNNGFRRIFAQFRRSFFMILPERVYLGYLVSMWWITAFPTNRVDTPVVPHVLPGVWSL